MLFWIPLVEQLLALLTMGSQIFLALLLVIWLVQLAGIKAAKKIHSDVWKILSSNAVLFAFIVVLVAMSGSLFFEHIVGLTPCELCWWQRIFMYPQVFLFGAALLWQNRDVFNGALVLSVVGGIISIYHYTIQIIKIYTPTLTTTCSATGPPCTSTQIVPYFGYITIPMMALTAFALVVIFYFANRSRRK